MPYATPNDIRAIIHKLKAKRASSSDSFSSEDSDSRQYMDGRNVDKKNLLEKAHPTAPRTTTNCLELSNNHSTCPYLTQISLIP